MMIINKKASRSREAFFWFYLDIISLLYSFILFVVLINKSLPMLPLCFLKYLEVSFKNKEISFLGNLKIISGITLS